MGAAVALIALASVAAAALVLERPRAKAWAVLAAAALLPVALVAPALGARRRSLAARPPGGPRRGRPRRRGGRRRARAPRRPAPGRAARAGRGRAALPPPGGGPGRPRGAGARGARRRPRRRGRLRGGATAPGALARRRAADAPGSAHPRLEWALAAGLVLTRSRRPPRPRPDAAAGTLVTALVPFALLFVLLRRADWTPRLVRTCAAAFVGVAVALVAVAVGEAATGRLLPAPRVVTDDRLADAFRASSLVFDPDALGRVLAVAALVVTAGLLWARRGRDLALAGVAARRARRRPGPHALLRGGGRAPGRPVVLAALRWGPRAAAGLAAGLVVAGLAAVLLAPGPLRLDRDPVAAADQATSARSALGARRRRARAPPARGGLGLRDRRRRAAARARHRRCRRPAPRRARRRSRSPSSRARSASPRGWPSCGSPRGACSPAPAGRRPARLSGRRSWRSSSTRCCTARCSRTP